MLLGPVMELCWLFSLLAVNEDSIVLQCTFAVLNVSQVSRSHNPINARKIGNILDE